MSANTDFQIKWGPRENWRILKNVVNLSIAFMVQYTAVHGTVNLQSSINVADGMGTGSMAAMYCAVLISSFFLPVVVIKWLGTKWTMFCCFAVYLPYTAAQLYPTLYTLIPTGALNGLGSSTLWCALCTYIATLSEAHSKITKTSMDVYIARYLGQFFMIFHLNEVWGNIISSVVLLSGDNIAATTSMNVSLIPVLCGANFLPSADGGKALLPQPPQRILILTGIDVACVIIAMFIIAVGVDSPNRYKNHSSEETQNSSSSLLLVTTKIILEPNQLLMVFLSIFIGLQQGFVRADLTVAFVSCAIGPGTVGYVMMTLGAVDAVGCCVSGFLVKIVGRVRLICCAIVLNTALYAFMLMWKPQSDLVYVHYLIAALAGLCDSVWLVQINAYYGIIFPGREEPAFAAFRLFEAIGFIITFGISPYFRTSSKIYLLFSFMCLGSIGYFMVEFRRRKKVKKIFNVAKNGTIDIVGCDNNAYQ